MARVVISQHSGNATTPVSQHTGITDLGRAAGGGGAYTELTQHTGNTGTPVDSHAAIGTYTEVTAH